MAAPISSRPPPGPPGEAAFTAADDVARLVETLHQSGTLRALNALVAQGQDVAAVALDGLNSEAGRNGLANLLILGKLLGHVDAGGLDRATAALERALGAAGERLGDEVPGTFTLVRKLRDPDVRRALDAALTLLGALGAELRAPQTPVPPPGGDAGARP